MNLSVFVMALDWPPTVTTTSTMPAEPAGLVALQDAALQTTFVAVFAPNLTEVPDVLKFAPLMVTTVPPVVEPDAGAIPVTVGAT